MKKPNKAPETRHVLVSSLTFGKMNRHLSILIFSIFLGGCSPMKQEAPASKYFSEAIHAKLRDGIKSELPKDYLDFIKDYDGNLPQKRFFWVVPNDWGSSIDQLYCMQDSELSSSLLQALHWDGIPLKSGLIPIGRDGAFGYILLSIRSEDYGAVFFCCTWSKDEKTDVYEGQGYWKIADSFSVFLKKLQKEPE